MTIRAQSADGMVHEFPDGTSMDVVDRAMADYAKGPPTQTADVAQGLAGGIERGLVGIAGLPGSVAQLTKSAADEAARQTVGRAYNRFAPGGTGTWEADRRPDPNLAPRFGVENLPSSSEVVSGYEALRGPTYRPQTTAGEYAATIGEAIGGTAVAPGHAIAKGLLGGLSGGASEAAGQAVQGTVLAPYETHARVAAGVAAPFAVARGITPVRTNPARDPLTERLAQEGITPTAAQRTGSRPLQALENVTETVMGGPPSVAERQARQFTQAASRRMGDDAELLSPDVMARNYGRLQQNYRDLSARNAVFADRDLARDLRDVTNRYEIKLNTLQRPVFAAARDDIINTLRTNNGIMPGEVYQQARSDLTRMARGARESDPLYSDAMRGLRNALDEAMGRSIRASASPDDARLWKETNRQYASYKTLEDAMRVSGPNAAQGYLSPAALQGAATRSAGNAATVRGQSDLGELARAGQLLRPLPTSGTPERLNALNILGAGLGGTAGGYLAGAPGILAGMAVPALSARAVMSRPVQGWLGNRLLDPSRQAAIQALIDARMGLERERPGGLLSRR